MLAGYCNKPSEQQYWEVRYDLDDDKKPYDRDFFIDLLKKNEGKDFHTLEERFSTLERADSNGLYFYFNQTFNPDATETNAILRFAAEGNTVFIAANDYSSAFFAHLRGVDVESKEHISGTVIFDSAHDVKDRIWYVDAPEKKTKITLPVFGYDYPLYTSFDIDTTAIDSDFYAKHYLDNEEFTAGYDELIDPDEEEEYDDEDYYYSDDEVEVEDYEYEEEYVEEDENYAEEEEYVYDDEDYGYYDESTLEDFPIPKYTVLAKLNDDRPVLIKAEFGKGVIYLHASPVLFTNSQLDKPEIFEHINTFWDQLNYEDVYWDQLRYQFLNNSRDRRDSETSYFKYIYKNRALKTAFIVLLVGLIIFVLVGIKRKYEAVPVVEPLRNSSIDFARTIARLYWLKPNHQVIALKKVNMFLFDVRSRYGIPTHNVDEEFRQKLIAKSGIQEKYINRLFDSYLLALNSETLHEDVLIRISQTINYIKRNWK
jgi:hypothetical protein